MHYCVTTNKKVTTESSGNNPGDYGSNSFFREDLNKLITDFKDARVEFVASCGDIVTSDVNDLIEFTHDYIKDWTGIDTYSGASFWSNENYKPFYCAIGNHDHWAVYSDADHCKYINYGNSVDHNGARWGVINYNGISYNCPEQLASLSSDITYAPGSLSYYVVPSGHPNDMFIFLSAYYGSRLPSASNPNYGDRNDMSQMHPHNQLDPTD
jgi:predicted phosphodiesterase